MKDKAYICIPISDNADDMKRALAFCKFVYFRCGLLPITSHFYAKIINEELIWESNNDVSHGMNLLVNSEEVWVFGDSRTEIMEKEIASAKSLGRDIHYIDDYQCEEIFKVYG